MTKKRIMTIVGARPQFIKAAVVSSAIATRKDLLEECIVHTGQHYDYNMSALFFRDLGIPEPQINLQVGSGSHGAQTGEMLKLIEREINQVKPDVVLVYGDTNSTLAGALAAAKLHIPVMHVEAGLRSFNKRMPEEINRVLTDHVSDLLFAPTVTAVNNLKSEGVADAKIRLVGDVMVDAMRFYEKKRLEKGHILSSLGIVDTPYIFATIHRSENTDDPKRLKEIFQQLDKIARQTKIVMPLHPRTKALLRQIDFKPSSDNFLLIDPQGYLETILLQRKSSLVITDSGGVQKEAFMNEKFCITVRPETEWVELVEAGYNVLADPIETLAHHTQQLLNKPFEKDGFDPYGDGNACDRIVDEMLRFTIEK